MTFGGNVILARLLDPSDFGLLGMVAVFSALAYNISGCGMSDGLINKQKPTERDYSTVFVFNASMGFFFGATFIVASGIISRFFGHEQLRGIMIAIGICFFFQSLALVQETKMRKELDFKKMAIVRLSSTASAQILGIILALTGYGYWGLVSTQIFLSVFMFIYYVTVSRWFPKISFDTRSFKELFGYGIHLMFAYICHQVARNINSSFLGKFFRASSSGLYSQAQKLQEVPFALSEAILNWPFFSVLANTHDQNERRRLTSAMHSTIIFVNVLIAAYLFAISAHAFHFLYGEKWDAAIPIFKILLAFGVITTVKMFYQTVFKVHAKTKLIRNLTVFEIAVQVALLSAFYDRGITFIALTQVIPSFVSILAYITLYVKYEGTNTRTFLRESAIPTLIPLAVLALTDLSIRYWIGYVTDFMALIGVTVIFTLILVAICEIIHPSFYVELRHRISRRKQART